MSKRESDSWWQFQARKFNSTPATPKIPVFKRPAAREPEPEPMGVEESDASDTVIQRIKRYWS